MSIFKNTTYNLAGSIIPVVVSLVSVPLYLQTIGLERYGFLALCWLILGYFGVFDLGLGKATAQKIASLSKGLPKERSEFFWTALFISLAVSGLAALILYPFADAVLGLIQSDNRELNAELSAALPWLAATVPVALVSGILSGALAGRERFGFINLVDGFSNILMSLAPLTLAWYLGPQLGILVAAALGSRLVVLALLFLGCYRWVPLAKPTSPKPPQIKALLRYGGWVSVSGIINPILTSWDRFAIGAVLGAGSVAAYVIPFTLVGRVGLIPGALSGAIFPRLASATPAQAEEIRKSAIAALSLAMTPIILLAIIMIEPFLALWLGGEIASRSADVAFILLPGLWINSFAQVPHALLQAQGRPNIVAKLHAAEVVPYILILQIGLLSFGLEGAALAWTIRVACDAILLFHLSSALNSLWKLSVQALIIVTSASVAVGMPADDLTKWALLIFLFLGGTILAVRSDPETALQAWRRARAAIRVGGGRPAS